MLTDTEKKKFPTLARFIAAGLVLREGYAYIAHASDGTWVQIGDTDRPWGADSYLAANPAPHLW